MQRSGWWILVAIGLALAAPSPAWANEYDDEFDSFAYGERKFQVSAGGVGAGAIVGVTGGILLGTGAWLLQSPGAPPTAGGSSAAYPMAGIGAAMAGWIGPVVINISAWNARSAVKRMGGRMPVTWGIFALLFSGVPGANYGFGLAYFGASEREYQRLLSRHEYGELDTLDDDEFDDLPEDEDELPWPELRPPVQLQIQPVVTPEHTGVVFSLSW